MKGMQCMRRALRLDWRTAKKNDVGCVRAQQKISRGGRAGIDNRHALGRAPNRRVDDDAGEQPPHAIRVRSGFPNL